LSNPVMSGGSLKYLARIRIDGSTARAPASNPASNGQISGMSAPPMNPMVPVLVLSAAAAPARKEPCSEANDTYATLG
jgi:hypothetical protein